MSTFFAPVSDLQPNKSLILQLFSDIANHFNDIWDFKYSSMYNRYIPPPKPKASRPSDIPVRPPPVYRDPEPEPLPQRSEYAEPAPVPVQTSSWLQPYAKRIDATAQPTKIVFGDDEPPAPSAPSSGPVDDIPKVATEEEEKTPEKSKSKKNKKSKGDEGGVEEKPKKRRRVEEEEQEDKEEDTPGVAEEAESTENIANEEQQDKRKPKREKKKKPKAEEPEEDDDAVRSRHKSVFEKVAKALQAQAPEDDEDKMDVDGAEQEQEEEPVVEHGLEPIPQPAPVAFDESKLTYETLPQWIASPIRVTESTTKSFEELKIAAEPAKVLQSKGFKEAFAVQTAVLPLLLPNPDRQGDVVVAAPTGSGKTLSYVLPMIQDISYGRITNLRALIVLPTRDLVQQVQQTCEACAAAFASNGGKRVKIGTAVGNKVFKEEQSAIVEKKARYGAAEDSHSMEALSSWTASENINPEDYASKVDVLICTPGRLVEHIKQTPGFTLDYVRWLVVDEADKLLAQDFQQWLNLVLDKLSVERRPSRRVFPKSNKKGVRKVILSATMTHDISMLNLLKLSRPKLVVLEGTKAGDQSLPPLLKEYAIKVREPSLKPLYLVDLLQSELLAAVPLVEKVVEEETASAPESSDSDSSSESDSSSGSDSDSDSESDSDSDSNSSSDSGSDSGSSSSDSDSSSESEADEPKPKAKVPATKGKFASSALIFTKSNEAALRLSRLLAILVPGLAHLIGTLTSTTKTIRRTHTLRAFTQAKLRILVASDIASRGLDLPNLEHVINYDLPISETAYVHRVGRTARAGRAGAAWTLLEHSEARRFWRDFAGEGEGASTNILRTTPVERVRLDKKEEKGVGEKEEGAKVEDFSEERVQAYERALAQLQQEAMFSRGKKGRKEGR